MAIIPGRETRLLNDYPSSDGKPIAETDWHRDLMLLLIEILRTYYAGQQVYVSGNLLVFYEQGNRRRHVSPDVFVVRGIENLQRPNYLIWEEGLVPEVVLELTSSSTKREDQNQKMLLYQNTLRVREYFLFDPRGDYLDPPLQGYRLRKGTYQPIRPQRRRLPSQVLGVHLERDEDMLRLWNPATATWLPTPAESIQQAEQQIQTAELAAETANERAEMAELAAETANERATLAEQVAELANQRAAELAAELERSRRQFPPAAEE